MNESGTVAGSGLSLAKFQMDQYTDPQRTPTSGRRRTPLTRDLKESEYILNFPVMQAEPNLKESRLRPMSS